MLPFENSEGRSSFRFEGPRSPRLLCLCLLCLFTVFPVLAAETKIAILAPEPTAEPLADLLTAELSGHNRFAILERAELMRVWGERSLSGMTSDALKQAGGLLGADMLLILDARRISHGYAANLRLVATHSGIALGWWENTAPSEELSNWAKSAASQIAVLAEKLDRDASLIPISFVGFNSPVGGEDARSLQREVNGLFLNRLGAEPRLLVLERQKLLEALMEKELNSEERTFWNGSCLLDGTINPRQLDAGKVEISVRLSPAGNPPLTFTLTGNRAELSSLSASFAAEVLKALTPGAQPKPWDAAAEAARFYEEAKLAARSGFWQEACAAADTAIALGKNDAEARLVRLSAYTGFVAPNEIDTFYRTIKPGFGLIEHYTTPPTRAELLACVEAASQLREFTEVMTSTGGSLRPVLQRAVETLGAVAMQYYFGAEVREGNEELLAQFRGAMREAITGFISSYHKNRAENPSASSLDDTLIEFSTALRRFAPLWADTPEAGVEMLHSFRTLPFWYSVEETSEKSKSFSWVPDLCGWQWLDRQRVDSVWRNFEVGEQHFHKAIVQLHGIARSATDAEVRSQMQRAISFFTSNRTQLAAVRVRTSYGNVLDRAWSLQSELMEAEARQALLTNEFAALHKVLSDLDTRTAQYAVPMRAILLPRDARPVDRMRLGLSKGEIPTAAQLAQLTFLSRAEKTKAIDLLLEIERLPDSAAKRAILPMAQSRLAAFERELGLASAATRPSPRPVPVQKASAPPTNHIMTLTALRVPLGATNAAVYRVAWDGERLWMLEGWMESRRWTNQSGGGHEFVERFSLRGFEPAPARSDSVPLPDRYFSFQQQPSDVQFVVLPTRIVLLFRNTVVVYDKRENSFTDQPVPLNGARLFHAEGRIILFNADTILRFRDDLKSFEVLASVRRRPALNPLDQLESYAKVQFGRGEHGRLAVRFPSGAYEMNGDSWRQVADQKVLPFAASESTHTDFGGARGTGTWAGEPFALTFIPFRHGEAQLSLGETGKAVARVLFPGRALNGNLISQNNVTVAGDNLFVWSSRAPGIWCVPASQMTELLQAGEPKGNSK